MHSFERCSQTAEQKYLDVQHIMENRHEIQCELNQALHSSKEIQKACQKLKDEVDAKHQTMVSKVNELVTAEWSKHEKETNERIEGLRALLSGDIVNVRTEISKAVFPVRNLAEEGYACLQKQIRGLQKEIEVLKLATTPQKSRKSPTKRTRKISRKE
jgi:archaellum component FlaC